MKIFTRYTSLTLSKYKKIFTIETVGTAQTYWTSCYHNRFLNSLIYTRNLFYQDLHFLNFILPGFDLANYPPV